MNKIIIGWKEIADYLGYSVSTAIRRQQDGLPVFRAGGQMRAYSTDLDKWMQGLSINDDNKSRTNEPVIAIETPDDLARIIAELADSESDDKTMVVRLGKDSAEFERIEIQLRTAEERYQELLESLSEWIWEMDESFVFTFSSPQIADMLGYTAEQILGHHISRFFLHPDDTEKLMECFNDLAIHNRAVHLMSFRFYHKEGSIRHIEISANPTFDTKGKLCGYRGVCRDISNRIRLERDIIRTRNYMSSVLNSSIDAIVATDQEGRITIWNRGAEKLFGYTLDEVRGIRVTKITMHWGEKNTFRNLRDQIIASNGWLRDEEVRCYNRSGELFYANASFSAVYSAEDEFNGICCIFHDITERKGFIRELEKSEEKWRMLFNSRPSGSFTVSDGIILDVNDMFCDLTGFSRDELVGKKCSTICPLCPGGCIVAASGGSFDSYETMITHRTGTQIPVIKGARRVQLGGKELIVENLQDIRDLKETERKLRENEERYRMLFEQASDGILLIEIASGKIVDFNETVHTALGYTREEFEKLQIKDLEASENPQEMTERMKRIVATGRDDFCSKHRTKAGKVLEAHISTRRLVMAGKDYIQTSIHYPELCTSAMLHTH